MWFYYYNIYSEGSRYGMLKKFSRKGNIFKTYEGEIVILDLFSNGMKGSSSNTFYFSVADPKVANDLQAILDNGESKFITVHYLQYRKNLPWRGENYNGRNGDENVGQYIVDKVVYHPEKRIDNTSSSN